MSDSEGLTGLVLAVQANYYRIQLEQVHDLPESELLCTRRSRLKKIGQRVMVGDRVVLEEPDWAGGRGAIAEILPRSRELDRPAIANVNQILLIFALAEPTPDLHQLSRFLIKAESLKVQVQIGLSKTDLVPVAEQQQWCDRLVAWGYQPIGLSLKTNQGIGSLAAVLQDRLTVIAGPSGVGKSSLINRLIPEVNLRVGAVSGKLGRGRHTTRHVELFALPQGGLLADTPGFNQPRLDCVPTELALYFPEIKSRLGTCQFTDCLHIQEPNCGVRGDWERYPFYVTLLEEAIARQSLLEQSGQTEAVLKVKSREAGQQVYEPKLSSKRYRRPSRRLQHQNLSDLYHDLEGSNIEELVE